MILNYSIYLYATMSYLIMTVIIDGIKYSSATEVIKEIGVSRQTLWRWRSQGKIPAGHRFRDRILLFDSAEIEEIRNFANRIEDINNNQLPLIK